MERVLKALKVGVGRRPCHPLPVGNRWVRILRGFYLVN